MAEAVDYGREEQDEDLDQDIDPNMPAAALEAISELALESRRYCVDGRYMQGMEEQWAEDEEFYEGIDDVNRHEFAARGRGKPWGQEILGDEERGESANQGSTVFFNMVRPYTDVASAKLGDMLLPSDDTAYSIQPTPVPEMKGVADARLTEAERTAANDALGEGAQQEDREDAYGKVVRGRFPQRALTTIERQGAGDERAINRSIYRSAEAAGKVMDEAMERASKAQKRIEDWHVECQFHGHNRRAFDDTMKLGAGVLKGPIPVTRTEMQWDREEGLLRPMPTTVPVTKRVSPWDCFPDPGCGESVHDGNCHWEREYLSRRAVAQLVKEPGFDRAALTEVLKQGPCLYRGSQWKGTPDSGTSLGDNTFEELTGLERRNYSAQYEMWTGYMSIPVDDLIKEQFVLPNNLPEMLLDEMELPVVVTIINNRIVRATLNPLDSGAIPYDYMVFQRMAGSPWGMGIPRIGRTAQRMINAAARNMLDNAGISGGPMLVWLEGVVEPFDGVYEIKPRKMWRAIRGANKEELENMLKFVEVPMVQEKLQAILQLGIKLLEDVTGLPMLIQGQVGNAPDTVGGMQMLNNNAGTVIRRVARQYDDDVTEPHVRRYYEWLKQYGDESEVGDLQVDARGSSTLVERELQTDALANLGGYVTNPIFKIDPNKWFKELLKSKKLDPRRLEYDDDKWRELVEKLLAQMEGGNSDAVMVAQLRGEVELQKEQMRSEQKALDREMKIAIMALDEEQEAQNREMTIALEALKREATDLDRDSQMTQVLAKIEADLKKRAEESKVRLAETMAKLKTQLALAGNETPMPQVATPVAEPPGRAPAGLAFQR